MWFHSNVDSTYVQFTLVNDARKWGRSGRRLRWPQQKLPCRETPWFRRSICTAWIRICLVLQCYKPSRTQWSIAWFCRPFYFDRATFAPPTVLNVLRSWLRRRRSFNLAQVVWPHFGRCSTVSHTRRNSNWKRLAFSTDLSPHGMVVYSFWCWEFPQSDASCEPRCRWEDSAALCCCLWSWIRRPLTVLAKDRQGKIYYVIFFVYRLSWLIGHFFLRFTLALLYWFTIWFMNIHVYVDPVIYVLHSLV